MAEGQRLLGQATAAKKNREQENRLRIIRALSLHISYHEWPDFIRADYTSPKQRIKYHQHIAPPPFQAPRFDRLCQSTKVWAKLADAAWKKHRDQFLRRCEAWVALGVDERINEKRARGSGKKDSATKGRGRGGNTPLEQRYEWAAKYLAGLPLKRIGPIGVDCLPSGASPGRSSDRRDGRRNAAKRYGRKGLSTPEPKTLSWLIDPPK